MRLSIAPVTLLTLAVLAGCSKPSPSQDAPTQPASSAAPAAVAASGEPAGQWIGRWQGPEGTFLDVLRDEAGRYRVTVQNLDGPRTFDATATAGGLRFVRDGVAEVIRPGRGPDTGMKWLADKRDCLVVKAGEGYCRD